MLSGRPTESRLVILVNPEVFSSAPEYLLLEANVTAEHQLGVNILHVRSDAKMHPCFITHNITEVNVIEKNPSHTL